LAVPAFHPIVLEDAPPIELDESVVHKVKLPDEAASVESLIPQSPILNRLSAAMRADDFRDVFCRRPVAFS
jgi:hypothetical protein